MAININSFYNLQVTRFGVFGGAFSSTDLRAYLGSTASALQWSSIKGVIFTSKILK